MILQRPDMTAIPLKFLYPRSAFYINPPFDGLSRGMGQVGYALLTRAPVVILEEQALPDVTPRLATPPLTGIASGKWFRGASGS